MAGWHEMGGYLEFERFHGESYHECAIALNSGRACLEYLIELRAIGAIWLPDWICSAVPDVCSRCGIEVMTYRIGADMLPVYDFEVSGDEYLYLVDYYGQLGSSHVDEGLRRSGGRLIVDEAQGFFRPAWSGADTLYTCRKFIGVADGGYLHTKDGMRVLRDLTRGESYAHMDHLLGRYEVSGSEFFPVSQANEARVAAEPMLAMSPLTENILRAVDYATACMRRDANFARLCDLLGERNLLELGVPDGAFMYPLLVDDASGIREKLAADGVYVPVLWPNVLEECQLDSVAFRYSKDILPLPVDQRYSVSDMDYLAGKIMGALR